MYLKYNRYKNTKNNSRSRCVYNWFNLMKKDEFLNLFYTFTAKTGLWSQKMSH